ncbi:hypothetical protein QKQ25_gp017 [Hyphantria cunea granulovirus]|uniref:P22.2 n=1 Tax=Hyphantria cunea granulovirus TaxID=307448 RepID=A0AAF1D254_9BBAC|nr:hypothetical protein QKQ25_gp017 [Hyphantria cunea granulovirus]QBQ01570.1 hypothetical protein HycuGV_00017 [Hyphantria cunea granulovirus]
MIVPQIYFNEKAQTLLEYEFNAAKKLIKATVSVPKDTNHKLTIWFPCTERHYFTFKFGNKESSFVSNYHGIKFEGFYDGQSRRTKEFYIADLNTVIDKLDSEQKSAAIKQLPQLITDVKEWVSDYPNYKTVVPTFFAKGRVVTDGPGRAFDETDCDSAHDETDCNKPIGYETNQVNDTTYRTINGEPGQTLFTIIVTFVLDQKSSINIV